MNSDYRNAVEIHSEMVYRLAITATGKIYDAEDITQNVFLKLLKNKKKFTDEEHQKAWLIKVTMNEIKLFKNEEL